MSLPQKSETLMQFVAVSDKLIFLSLTTSDSTSARVVCLAKRLSFETEADGWLNVPCGFR